MKQLLLIRHAKSSWDDPSQNDFDRPLNKRGKKDAPEMAERLLDKKIKIDAFLSSPAERALDTCIYFTKAFDVKKKEIIQIPELYNAQVENFYKVVSEVDNSFDTIALFSHNPGITEFVNELTDVHIDDMPTCSIFAVKADIKNWEEFTEGEKLFWFYDYPKLKE
ncbi:MAG TPA: histidine phosphatase family protein [Chitinophagaceae bacterium]|nr:histidine phosphatase family protein [Chitinophagaceae bacterium]